MGLTGVRAQLFGLIGLGALGSVGLSLIAASNARDALLDERAALVRHLAELGRDVAKGLEARVQGGLLSRAEAERLAKETLGALKTGAGGGFWVATTDGTRLVEPTSAIATADFDHLIKLGSRGGAAVLHNTQQSATPAQPLDATMSYAVSFAPWGWVVGIGLPLADIEANAAD